MALTEDQHAAAFDRSGGRCAYCGKALSWSNHGRMSGRGAHETDHRVPRARGGSNHGNNLISVCADCNMKKSDMSSRIFKRLMAAERQARHERRLNYNIQGAVAPAAIVGGLTFLCLKKAFDVWQATPLSIDEEEQRRRQAQLLWAPLLVGAGVLGLIVAYKMSRR